MIRLALAALTAGALGAACGASGNGGLAVAGSSRISTPPPASSSTPSSGTGAAHIAVLRPAGRLRHPPRADRVGGGDRLRLGHAVGSRPAVRPSFRHPDPDRRRHRQTDRSAGAAAALDRPLQAGGGRWRPVAGRRPPGVADRPRHRPAAGHPGRGRTRHRTGGGSRVRVGGGRHAGRRRAAADRPSPGHRPAPASAWGGGAVGHHRGRRPGAGWPTPPTTPSSNSWPRS